jgi:diacylglycerol kinase
MINPIKNKAKDIVSAVICWAILIVLLISDVIFKRK